MKNIKRVIFILVLIILFGNFVYAATTLSTNLSKTKFGPNSTLQGYVNLSFTGYKELDEIIRFSVGSETYDLKLNDVLNISGLLDSPNVDLIKASYTNSTGSKDSSVSLTFLSAGSKTEVGIDLRGGSVTQPRQPGDVNVENLSFNLKPDSGAPKDVSIYIGDKRVYRFAGDASGWAGLDSSYINLNNPPEGSQDMTAGSIICQGINLTDSNRYKINVTAKKLGNSQFGVNATIADEVLSGPPDCSNPDTPCCGMVFFPGLNNNYGNFSCEIQRQIPEKRMQYVCIYLTGLENDDGTTRHLKVGLGNSNNINAFVNGENAESNFYIYGSYQTYNRTLLRQTSIVLNPEDINAYIHGETCSENCLLIPFKITMGNDGTIVLKNLSLPYTSGVNALNEESFRKIKYNPTKIGYDGTINLKLSDFDKILTPSRKDDYKYYVGFDGKTSNKVDFDVVEAPTAAIAYAPLDPGINQLVTFDASRSRNVLGRNITSFNWDFGDGQTGNNSINTHAYNSTGRYKVKLTILDTSDIFSSDSVIVRVVNSSTSGDAINNTNSQISNFRSYLDSSTSLVKDTASLIGINNLVNGLQSNLTILRTRYDVIIGNASLNDSIKSTLINPILQELNVISNNIPVGINVQSSSSSAKVSNLNQIGSCCEFTTELQRNKLLASQKDVTVNAEARSVVVTYKNRTDSFIVVKKSIVGSGLKIYEFLPSGLIILPQNVISGGVITPAGQNIYSFVNTNQLVYRIDNSNLAQALQIKTAILPLNLEGVQINVSALGNNAGGVIILPSKCGNSICERDENKTSCAKDCSPDSNIIYFVIGGLVIILFIIYFGLFFKGGILNKKFGGNKSKTSSGHGFKSEKDYIALKQFVDRSFHHGLGEIQVRTVLKSKGWHDSQINMAINEVMNSRRK